MTTENGVSWYFIKTGNRLTIYQSTVWRKKKKTNWTICFMQLCKYWLRFVIITLYIWLLLVKGWYILRVAILAKEITLQPKKCRKGTSRPFANCPFAGESGAFMINDDDWEQIIANDIGDDVSWDNDKPIHLHLKTYLRLNIFCKSLLSIHW